MKKSLLLLLSLFFTVPFLSFAHTDKDLKAGFQTGDPGIRSINAMAFGPEGILFLGDSKNAEIIAIDTKDSQAGKAAEQINIQHVDKQIAALLGTTTDDILIQDMAVNPVSKSIYLAIHTKDGQPMILKTNGKDFEPVALNPVSHSKIGLNKAITADAKDRRGRSMRQWAISDLAFYEGKVMVSGLSSEEFASTFRSIPFPFNDKQMHASLEIYHAAHGQYETHAPIKTFMPFKLNGQDHLIASYTCTPLVVVPLQDFKPGKHTKGKTVAELGNRNTPLDIISYEKEGKSYILMANSSRALMKIDPAKIEQFEDYLTEPVEESSATAGVSFINLPYVNVLQLDKLDDQSVVMLQRMSNGDLNLHATGTRRL